MMNKTQEENFSRFDFLKTEYNVDFVLKNKKGESGSVLFKSTPEISIDNNLYSNDILDSIILHEIGHIVFKKEYGFRRKKRYIMRLIRDSQMILAILSFAFLLKMRYSFPLNHPIFALIVILYFFKILFTLIFKGKPSMLEQEEFFADAFSSFHGHSLIDHLEESKIPDWFFFVIESIIPIFIFRSHPNCSKRIRALKNNTYSSWIEDITSKNKRQDS